MSNAIGDFISQIQSGNTNVSVGNGGTTRLNFERAQNIPRPGEEGTQNITPGVNTPTILDSYRDELRGKMFKGKILNNLGIIETVKHTIEEAGKQVVLFESGNKCNVIDLSKLFDVYAETPQNPRVSDSLRYDDEPDELSINPNIYNGGKQVVNRQQQNTVSNRVVKKFDPVIEILSKKKKKPVKCNFEIELNLPSKELFETLEDSFDDVDLKILEYLLSPDNINEFKHQFRNAIRKFYLLEEVEYEETEKILEQTTNVVDEIIDEKVVDDGVKINLDLVAQLQAQAEEQIKEKK